jgi:hypothetical protein
MALNAVIVQGFVEERGLHDAFEKKGTMPKEFPDSAVFGCPGYDLSDVDANLRAAHENCTIDQDVEGLLVLEYRGLEPCVSMRAAPWCSPSLTESNPFK